MLRMLKNRKRLKKRIRLMDEKKYEYGIDLGGGGYTPSGLYLAGTYKIIKKEWLELLK